MLDDAAKARPVIVLSGFLGSGKTTLLNRLLRDPRLTDTAVIVNEFGAIGLDHLLVESAYDDMVLMDNGCLCCSVRGDLADTLRDLDRRAATGEIPDFGRVMIETTGLADPGPIAQTLVLDDATARRFVLQGVVATVDGLHGAETLRTYPEARAQVAMADLLVLTKSDLLAPGAGLAGLTGAIRALNGQAPIMCADHGALDPAILLGLDATQVVVPDGYDHGAHPGAHHHDNGGGHHHGHNHAHAHATGDIETATLIFDNPQDWDDLAGWLEWMTALRGPDILRIKGILAVTGLPGPVLLHGVQHVFSPPRILPDWPDADHRSRLVVIARDVPAQAITASWAGWCTAGMTRRAPLV
jgi:G3E family GTPase